MKLALLIALTQGCVFISDREYDWRTQPGDGGSDGADGGGACEELTWWTDADGDGLGDAASPVEACDQPSGTAGNDDDCDDSSASIGSGIVFYADADGDGYGDASTTATACSAPAGHLSDDRDCDDSDAAVNPGAAEDCATAFDDDCDGDSDTVDAVNCREWFGDSDGDGWGDGPSICRCEADAEHPVDKTGDCDDGDPATNPGVVEICFDGIDNDCDGGPNDCALGGTETLASGLGSELQGSADDAALGVLVSRVGDIDGDGRRDFVVGANGAFGGGEFSGELYLLTELPASIVSLPDGGPTIQGDAAGDRLGRSAADVGDLDGDGLDDLLVGAPSAEQSRSDSGQAYLVLGPITGTDFVSSRAQLTVTGAARFDYLGRSLAPMGDLATGADLAIGASGDDTGGSKAGAVYLFAGTLSGDVGVDDAFTTILGSAAGAGLGRELSAVGDTDGDGATDLLAGEPTASLAAANAGAAMVFSSAMDGTVDSTDADILFIGVAAGDFAGSSVGAAGDHDRDGRFDVLIGAVGEDTAADGSGATYIVEGSYGGTVSLSDALATLLGVAEDDGSGTSVAGDGDVDGDGSPDVVVGVPGDDGGGAAAGAAHVFFGPLSGTLALEDADVVLLGAAAGDAAGSSVAIVDDLTGDGTDELLIGAPYADPGGSSSGGAWLVLGGGL